jgi:hypothetical protein
MIETRSTVLSDFPARLKTKWGQYDPYNRQCPVISGLRAPTGCAITAGAQALSFFQTIDTVSWSHSQYGQSGSSALNWPQIISDCEDWGWAVANERWWFVDAYYGEDIYGYGRIGNGRATTNQVAHLMRYLGVNINATYSSTTTNAFAQNLLNFLKYSCGLTSSSTTLMSFNVGNVFNSFNDPNTLILTVAYTSTSLGHGWIIDGGQVIVSSPTSGSAEVFLHCNYGWDSYCDGYYLGAAFDCTYGPIYTNPNIELGGGRDIELLYDIKYAILQP